MIARPCALLLVLLCSSLQAASAPSERPASVLAGVKELEKPITYSETKIPLGELITRVAKDTGASLTAARDVADEPVAVVVREMPAHVLLEELAELLGYRWGRHSGVQASGRSGAPEGQAAPVPRSRASAPERPNARTPERPPRYEIYQDLASRQHEEALREGEPGGVERSFQRELEEAVRVANLPEAELQKLLAEANAERRKFEQMTPAQRSQHRVAGPEEERMRRLGLAGRLSQPVPHALARLLGRLTPEQWTALRGGEILTFASDREAGAQPMPAETERELRAARPEGFRGIPPTDPMLLADQQRRVAEARDQWATATGFRVTLRMDPVREATTRLGLMAEASPVRTGSAIPAPPLGVLETQFQVSAATPAPPPTLDEDTPERRAAYEKDPVLGVRRQFFPRPKPRPNTFSPRGSRDPLLRDVLPEMARVYGVQFIADAYWTPMVFYPATGEETVALHTLLDHPAIRQRQHWDRRGSLIRLRTRNWHLARPREIPLRMVSRWEQFRERQGALPLDEWVSMATTLSDAQITSLGVITNEVVLLPEFQYLERNRHVLRLVGTLTPGQREALWRGETLAPHRMTPPQQLRYQAAVSELQGQRYSNMPALVPNAPGEGLSLTRRDLVRLISTSSDRFDYLDRMPEALSREEAKGRPIVPHGASQPRPLGPAPAGPAVPLVGTKRFPLLDLRFRIGAAPEGQFRVPVAPVPAGAP